MPHGLGDEHYGRVATISAHIITVKNNQITALHQITDTVRWTILACGLTDTVGRDV